MTPILFEPPRVLVVCRRGPGELLLVTPFLRVLRACHPQAEVTVLTDRHWVPLLAENPRVDLVLGVGSDDPIRDVAARLRLRPCTHLLDFDRSAWSRALRALVPGRWRVAGATAFGRWLHAATGRTGPADVRPLPERHLGAARGLGLRSDERGVELFLDEASRVRARQWLERAGLGQERGYVALAPGSVHAVRRWPPDAWTQLIRKLVHANLDVVVVGHGADGATASEVAIRGGARAGSAAGDLDLLAIAALIADARGLVAVDNGLVHLAAGVGTPAVVVHGPTVREYGTYPWHAHAAVMERELECRPCTARNGAGCPEKHHLCMRAIRPDHVFATLARLMAPPGGEAEAVPATTADVVPAPTPSRWSYLPN